MSTLAKGRIDRLILWIARIAAIFGGLVLCVLIALTCLNILGRIGDEAAHAKWLGPVADWIRSTGVGPIRPTYELVEAGMACVVFAFLPLCQLAGAHARVDVVTDMMPRPLRRALTAFWEVVLGLGIALITWRLWVGLGDKISSGETTFLLQMPLWWAYAASFVAALIACLVAAYCAGIAVAGLLTGGPLTRFEEGEA